MEESYADWKSLPTEILITILRLADSPVNKANVCNYALVCKAWLYSAQSVIYSKVNHLENLTKLRKFVNTVEDNTSLGEMVKVLNLKIIDKDKEYDTHESANAKMLELLTTLVSNNLPNLETVGPYEFSYAPVLKALNNSHLKRLKILDPPSSRTEENEVESYVKCALLMKDRIETLTIERDNGSVDEERIEKPPYTRLYNELPQFKKLKEIYIKRETSEEAQVLEYVVETCKSLKAICFYFKPPNNESSEPPSADAISNITPRPEIKRLDCCLNASSGHKMLQYITDKFPQLDQLYLTMINNGHERLNECILTHLLYYLSEINCFVVSKLTVDLNTFTETVASFWNAESKPGSEYVKICYSIWIRNTQNIIELSKTILTSENRCTSLTFPLISNTGNIEWKHIDFLQQNGTYIRELQLNLGMARVSIPDDWELAENFFIDLFTQCPNLEKLYFVKCVLKQSPYTTTDLNTNFSLEELFMNDCKLHGGILEQASQHVHNIKRLVLGDLMYEADVGSRSFEVGYLDLQIIMSHTHIDTIVFQRNFRRETMYLKLHVLNNNAHYYYRLGSISREFVVLSEEAYLGEIDEDERRVYICCLNKPSFRTEPPNWKLL